MPKTRMQFYNSKQFLRIKSYGQKPKTYLIYQRQKHGTLWKVKLNHIAGLLMGR